MLKQRRFNTGQVYVALSRATSLNGLYLTGTFNKNSITIDQRASIEYEKMRKNSQLSTRKEIDDIHCERNSLTFTLLNVRSLKKHSIDIKCNHSIINSNLSLCTCTYIK